MTGPATAIGMTRSGYHFIFFTFVGWLITGCGHKQEVAPAPAAEFNEIKIMTYNVLFSTSNEETLDVLKQTGADIIGVQEASPARLIDLAQNLNYKFHSFSKTSGNLSDQDTGILSRFPISGFFDNGVIIKVNPGLDIAVFTVHLSPYPYEPYDFRDGVITTPQQAVSSASGTRLPEIGPVLDEIDDAKTSGIPVFLTGDFNEPSLLDWNALTSAHHFDKVVEWPVSKAITQSGLIDVYRAQFPNPANFPGNTWTTIESANEVYDRIDIIYQTDNARVNLSDIRLVGGVGDAAGITVTNYPSDHYAVIATYSLLK